MKDRRSAIADIFAEENRGLLLDIVVFVLNLFLMRELSVRFFGLVRSAAAENTFAIGALFLFFLSLLFFPPAAAILKRWRFHQRRKREIDNDETEDFALGCFFNPIFYFCLTAIIFSIANAFILQFFEKSTGDEDGTFFVSMIFFGIVMIVTSTILVYRYFSPPQREPRFEFFRSPTAEIIGDIFIFLNMIFYQILWNGFMIEPTEPVQGIGDLASRLFFLVFASLLFYFPPRIFYFYDDIAKPRTWFTILLANAPIIVRVMLGR